MASPSLQRGAARAPPVADELAAFYKLVDKQVIAGALCCRHARHAELSASAAVQAEALFGNDNLVVAELRICEFASLSNLAVEASGAEQDTLVRQTWAILVSLIPLLLRRVDANTLLPGTLREEELDYTAHVQAATKKAQNIPVLSPARLRVLVSALGYNTLVEAMYNSLAFLPGLWPAAQKRMVESFVLQGLDVIPRTAGIPADMISAGEIHLVAIFEKDMNACVFDPAFRTAILRKWRSNAVSSVLRARGVLQTGCAKLKQTNAEFEARQRADIAKHGLRDCALPSCSKTEKTVKEFAGCSGCRFVVYCCPEHQALDWRAHRKACREKEAARLAAEEEGEGDKKGEGAAAAA